MNIKNIVTRHPRGSRIALVALGTLTACAIAASTLVAASTATTATPAAAAADKQHMSAELVLEADMRDHNATPAPAETPSPAPEPTTPAQPQVEEASGTYFATAQLRIRSEASTDSAVVGTLAVGDKIDVNGTLNGFYRLADGRGWASADFLSTDAPAAPAQPAAPQMEAASGTLYTTTSLRIRSEANTSSSIVATLGYGTAVTVDGKQDGWYHLSDGRGWVSGEYLSASAPAPQTSTIDQVIAWGNQYVPTSVGTDPSCTAVKAGFYGCYIWGPDVILLADFLYTKSAATQWGVIHHEVAHALSDRYECTEIYNDPRSETRTDALAVVLFGSTFSKYDSATDADWAAARACAAKM